MNRAAAVSFALLFCSAILIGQNPNQDQIVIQKSNNQILVQKSSTAPDGSTVWTTQTLTPAEAQKAGIRIPAQVSSCPVSLRAKQAPGGSALEVNGARPKGIAQFLHLIVSTSDSRRIVAANVTVHGLTPNSRLTPAIVSQDSADGAKTLDVSFTAGQGKEVSADLAVPGLSAVRFVDLNSVTYSDGSTWKLAAGSYCRVPIDGFMLVGNR